jgi:pimeloyl-ACP methyl ester carboxylesterase
MALTPDRRRFLGIATGAVATAGLGLPAHAVEASPHTTSAAAGTTSATANVVSDTTASTAPSASFGPVRQIKAGVLNVGYVEAGPANGRPVLLLHGFPYDIHSYVEVAPLLAAEGYRVIVPYFRGYGTTTFLSADTPRNVDQAAFALDTLALMDALGIDQAILAGYDWGSRTADIIAALWPERVKALVSVTGYLITNLAANLKPIPPQSENDWWYQYYFCTERGVQGLTEYTSAFTEFVWRFNSPRWNFSADTLGRTVAAFANADFVPIVIGNYRWRLSLAPAEPEYAAIEAKLQQAPSIGVPTITVDGAQDPFTPAGNGSSYRAKFTGAYQHRVFEVGHNVPQEDPRGFARAVVDADRM